MEESKKRFTISSEAWYKEIISGDPYINIGLYEDEDLVGGEVRFYWNKIGIQLRVYDDSWESLSKMPELIGLMARIQNERLNPTIQEFAALLKEIGFVDVTEREEPRE